MNNQKYYPHITRLVTRSYYYPFFFYPDYYLQNIYYGKHNSIYDPDEYSKYESFYGDKILKKYYRNLFLLILILLLILLYILWN